jgi:hypothetical protein
LAQNKVNDAARELARICNAASKGQNLTVKLDSSGSCWRKACCCSEKPGIRISPGHPGRSGRSAVRGAPCTWGTRTESRDCARLPCPTRTTEEGGDG